MSVVVYYSILYCIIGTTVLCILYRNICDMYIYHRIEVQIEETEIEYAVQQKRASVQF